MSERIEAALRAAPGYAEGSHVQLLASEVLRLRGVLANEVKHHVAKIDLLKAAESTLASKSLALEEAVKALEGIASNEDCCCLLHDDDNLCCITELGLRRMCEEALAALKTAQEVRP